MSALALVATATLARLGARTWYDHVASKDNPVDVLSRDAWADPVVATKLATGEWVELAAIEPQWSRGLDFDYWWGVDQDESS